MLHVHVMLLRVSASVIAECSVDDIPCRVSPVPSRHIGWIPYMNYGDSHGPTLSVMSIVPPSREYTHISGLAVHTHTLPGKIWFLQKRCTNECDSLVSAWPHENPKAEPAALCTAAPTDEFMPERATSPATPAPMRERTSCLQRTYPIMFAQLSATAVVMSSSQSNLKLKKHPTCVQGNPSGMWERSR